MGQLVVRNVSDEALETFRHRAKLKGTSLEQEIRELIENHARLSGSEKVAVSRWLRSQTKGTADPLTLNEIREGLE